ncbi:MAG: hypothetical protein KGZ25_12700 [Planctomycetes bacterium]|nr:hypothetical protein [Planctomycetota bacterium]
MEAAVEKYASWGCFGQGAGAGEKPYVSIRGAEREKNFDELSGVHTPPVNWTINTERKKQFFGPLKTITSTSEAPFC